VGDGGVGASSKLANGLLDKRALGVASAEESEVDDQQNPATLREGKSRQHQAEQEQDLESGDNTHAGIVVLLDEAANGLSERVLLAGGLGARGARRGRASAALRGLQGRDQVHAGVGRNVEDRVHAEGQEGQNDLARVQPDESHSYRSIALVYIHAGCYHRVTHRGIGRSHRR
jgi:hypothetical protein